MIETIKKEFNDFVQNSLNPQQCAGVIHPNKALLIIAGAGSGKTRVITSRIAHLMMNEQHPAESIVALTFTNKAAGEMKERLIKTFQGHYKLPFIGTFHSYCLLQLRSNPSFLPFPNFSILDADDQINLIKTISKKYAVAKHLTPSNISYSISQYKNKSFSEEPTDAFWFSPILRDVYLEYESEKARSHCLDFDDLILQVLNLLKSNPTFKEQIQKKVRHVLVDEYQDTSVVQHTLLKEIALKDKKFILDSLCAVGDEDQSIYSWRGATVANILTFQNDFAPVSVIKIEQNYRSAQPILDAANKVIANNRLRNPKNLWSTKKAKNRILVLESPRGDYEAAAIALAIKTIAAQTSLSSIAILYRTHFLSRPLEEALIHQAIPYRIIGGIRFYERKEIKDLLAYLRLIINPYDKISLLRVINVPGRGLGQKFEEELLQTWNNQPLLDFKQILGTMLPELSGLKHAAVNSFINLFATLDTTAKPSRILDDIISAIGYITHLTTAYDAKEAQTKIENVQELVQAIMMFEQKDRASNDTKIGTVLERFLNEVALLQEKIEADSETEHVQLMTLHAAKGLEFDTVILTGLEEGVLPSSKSLNTNQELEEERRLMYVGMTRAREHLIITHAHSRLTYGTVTDQAPSRFLKEIPDELVHTIDLETTSLTMMQVYVNRWVKETKQA